MHSCHHGFAVLGCCCVDMLQAACTVLLYMYTSWMTGQTWLCSFILVDQCIVMLWQWLNQCLSCAGDATAQNVFHAFISQSPVDLIANTDCTGSIRFLIANTDCTGSIRSLIANTDCTGSIKSLIANSDCTGSIRSLIANTDCMGSGGAR